MNFTGKKTTVDDIGPGNYTLYTGMTLLRVVGINPTQEELKKLGYKADKAPSYFDEKNGHRVVFFVEGKDGDTVIRTNVSYFIKNEMSTLWIDRTGKFSSDRTKLDQDSVRQSFKGEANLIIFIKNWVNSEKGSDAKLSSIQAIATSGNITELKNIFKHFPDNVFKGLLYVREGKYQACYDTTERGFSDDFSRLHESLVKRSKTDKGLNGDFGPVDMKLYRATDFSLREYAKAADKKAGATAQAKSNTAAATTATQNAAVNQNEPVVVDEENPF